MMEVAARSMKRVMASFTEEKKFRIILDFASVFLDFMGSFSGKVFGVNRKVVNGSVIFCLQMILCPGCLHLRSVSEIF